MNIEMTVDTGAVERPSVGHGIGLRVVAATFMACLAQARRSDLQQWRVIGAVRRVAVQTVLDNRRMLPQEWAALVRMAGCAEHIHGHGCDHLFRCRPVRIMATRAENLSAFSLRRQWHVGRSLELHRFHLVALAAEVVLYLV